MFPDLPQVWAPEPRLEVRRMGETVVLQAPPCYSLSLVLEGGSQEEQ